MNTELVRGKRVLVTGGTGFVGSRVVPLLLRAGASVTLLCRQSSDTSHFPDTVEVVRCDLSTGSEVRDTLARCDVFVHMAALLFGLSWRDYLSSNCGVAQNIARSLESLGDNGPERVIFVSSLAAAGPCADRKGKREDEPAAPVSAYGWSKLLSENILKAAAGDRLVILRPPIVYGSGDSGLLPVFRGLQKGVGVVPGLGRDFPVSVIHVDDVAQAVFLACDPGASGVYHLGDGDVRTMAEFYLAAAEALGTEPRLIRLPLWLMGATAWLSTVFAQGLAATLAPGRRAPNWNMDKYREAAEAGWVACTDRARADLGFLPTRDLRSGMAEAVEGYRACRLL